MKTHRYVYAIVLVLSLAGCSGGDDTPAPASTPDEAVVQVARGESPVRQMCERS